MQNHGIFYEIKLRRFTLPFFLPFVTFSNKGLLLGPFLEHGGQDMRKSLNSLAFSYIWSLDLCGSCLFVYQTDNFPEKISDLEFIDQLHLLCVMPE